MLQWQQFYQNRTFLSLKPEQSKVVKAFLVVKDVYALLPTDVGKFDLWIGNTGSEEKSD